MERDGSMQGLENSFDKLALEKARNADVDDLDDDGWRIASMDNRIIELGGLGEGAGGAVTRCQLKGGKTVFALKVCFPIYCLYYCDTLTYLRSSRRIPTLMLRSRLYGRSTSTRSAHRTISAATMELLSTLQLPLSQLPWSFARVDLSIASTKR
jgi:mitogen-activated protein kinase kinase